MSRSAEDILREFRIDGVDPNKVGRQYTTCPGCSADRTGYNRKSRCLAVNIDHDGVRFFCNHCEDPQYHTGRLFEDERRPAPTHRPTPGGIAARAMPKPPTNGYDTMHRAARASWGHRR